MKKRETRRPVRNQHVGFKVTEDEKLALILAAERSERELSDYVRWRLFGEASKKKVGDK